MEHLETAILAAREGGRIALSYYDTEKGIRYKDATQQDFVTKADIESEAAIVKILKEHYPSYNILTEESLSKDQHSPYTWIIDPIDGTSNFAKHIPIFMVGVGLAHGNDLIAAAAYDPLHDELFTAEKGKGAYCNGKPIHVSSRTFRSSYIILDWTRDNGAPRFFNPLFESGAKIQILRSAIVELCSVACGRMDGAIMRGQKPWDLTPTLIVREAGGVVTTLDGEVHDTYSRDALVSNGIIHDDLLKHTRGHG
jgi:myo-inositol-1(or 4)-monophosphatase